MNFAARLGEEERAMLPQFVWIHIIESLSFRETCTLSICSSELKEHSTHGTISSRRFLIFHDASHAGLMFRLMNATSNVFSGASSSFHFAEHPVSAQTSLVLVPENDPSNDETLLRASSARAPTATGLSALLTSAQASLERLELVGAHRYPIEIADLLFRESAGQTHSRIPGAASSTNSTSQHLHSPVSSIPTTKPHFPKLATLVLRGCEAVTPSCVHGIASSLLPRLQHLDLSWCPGVTETAAWQLVLGGTSELAQTGWPRVLSPTGPRLRSLDLCATRTTFASIFLAPLAFPALRQLNLGATPAAALFRVDAQAPAGRLSANGGERPWANFTRCAVSLLPPLKPFPATLRRTGEPWPREDDGFLPLDLSARPSSDGNSDDPAGLGLPSSGRDAANRADADDIDGDDDDDDDDAGGALGGAGSVGVVSEPAAAAHISTALPSLRLTCGLCGSNLIGGHGWVDSYAIGPGTQTHIEFELYFHKPPSKRGTAPFSVPGGGEGEAEGGGGGGFLAVSRSCGRRCHEARGLFLLAGLGHDFVDSKGYPWAAACGPGLVHATPYSET